MTTDYRTELKCHALVHTKVRSRRGGLCITGETHTPRTFLTYQTTKQMPGHCAASEHRVPSWHTYVDNRSAPQCLMESPYMRANPQQNWQKLWNATREGHHSDCAHLGTTARKEEGQIEVLAGRSSWHWQHKNLHPGTITNLRRHPGTELPCQFNCLQDHSYSHTHTDHWKTISRKGLSPQKKKGFIVLTVLANLKAR